VHAVCNWLFAQRSDVHVVCNWLFARAVHAVCNWLFAQRSGVHTVCKTFLDAQRRINIHTARTNERTATSLIMSDESTKINRPRL
jgi:hypothetical protein